MGFGGGGAGGLRARRARLTSAGAAATIAVLALLVTPALTTATATATASQAATGTATVAEMEAAFVARVNQEREARGGSVLTMEEDLAAVGREHSADMATEGRVYHNPLLAEQVQDWEVLGENVGAGGSVEDIHVALMASTTHRDVILNPRFNEVGVGVVEINDKLWITQVFRRRAVPVRAAEASEPADASPPATSPPATSPAPTSPPPATSLPSTSAPVSITAASAVATRPAPRITTTTVAPAATLPAPEDATTGAVTPETAAPSTSPSLPAPSPAPWSDGDQTMQSAASIPIPVAAELPAAGLLAAALLWAVVAGLTGVTIRLRPRLAVR